MNIWSQVSCPKLKNLAIFKILNKCWKIFSSRTIFIDKKALLNFSFKLSANHFPCLISLDFKKKFSGHEKQIWIYCKNLCWFDLLSLCFLLLNFVSGWRPRNRVKLTLSYAWPPNFDWSAQKFWQSVITPLFLWNF